MSAFRMSHRTLDSPDYLVDVLMLPESHHLPASRRELRAEPTVSFDIRL